jgi:predicted ferric reductase
MKRSAAGWQRRGGRQAAPARGHRRLVGDVAAVMAGLGLGVVLALCWPDPVPRTWSAGSALTLVGRVTGMVGTYGVLLCLLLVSRLSLLEREIGQDRLVRWHRRLAPWSLSTVAAHVVLVTVGYSLADGNSIPAEVWELLRGTGSLALAVAGLLLMAAAAVTSIRAARHRVDYETWWAIHLYTYLGVALAFGHQLALGPMFLGHPWARGFWIAVYVACVLPLVVFRAALPLGRSLRHGLRVSEVRRESADVVSVYIGGRDMRRIPAVGGQFYSWRFLTRGLWTQSHPYSLSAAPDGNRLRITVRALGGHSAALARLKPGTRVIAEGPYGVFRADTRHSERIVLVAGGVGIAPIRALLEELPEQCRVDLVYRASSREEVLFADELDRLSGPRHSRVHYLVGDRRQHPMDATALNALVPDLAQADVYVCGSAAMVAAVQDSCTSLGVPRQRFHTEAFDYHG